MKILSVCVALFGLLALVVAEEFNDLAGGGLGVTALISALAIWRSVKLSSFLKIFVGDLFDRERSCSGCACWRPKRSVAGRLCRIQAAGDAADHRRDLLDHRLPRRADEGGAADDAIADPYFNTTDAGQARIWPLPAFTSLERRIAVAMVVFLVLINQAQVGITVRLSFFNRDWFNAIQSKDAATFWELLLFVFMPWAFVYVASAVIEFVVQSMLVIRWRRWLTDYFVSRWLGGPYPLPHEPDRQRGRQSRPAHRRRRQPLHRRRREGSGAATASIPTRSC